MLARIFSSTLKNVEVINTQIIRRYLPAAIVGSVLKLPRSSIPSRLHGPFKKITNLPEITNRLAQSSNRRIIQSNLPGERGIPGNIPDNKFPVQRSNLFYRRDINPVFFTPRSALIKSMGPFSRLHTFYNGSLIATNKRYYSSGGIPELSYWLLIFKFKAAKSILLIAFLIMAIFNDVDMEDLKLLKNELDKFVEKFIKTTEEIDELFGKGTSVYLYETLMLSSDDLIYLLDEVKKLKKERIVLTWDNRESALYISSLIKLIQTAPKDNFTHKEIIDTFNGSLSKIDESGEERSIARLRLYEHILGEKLDESNGKNIAN